MRGKMDTVKIDRHISYQRIYKCPKCRRAWQKPLNEKNYEYYPEWIMGDTYKICPSCNGGDSHGNNH